MTVAGLIFSNIHDQSIPEMTRMRTMASIPYGCRYRLIDFALSNMVNSGITTVGIITHYNYQSLMDHIGTGKDWDLARRSGGIKLLPPYVTAFENSAASKLYENRLEAMMGAENYINRCGADYMVLCDCDTVLNINLKKVVRAHINSGADITMVTKRMDAAAEQFENNVNILTVNGEGRVTASEFSCPKEGLVSVNTNVMVIKRDYLQKIIADSMAKGYKSFSRDVIIKHLDKIKLMAYEFEGHFSRVESLTGYFKSSMELLDEGINNELFASNHPIYTKVRNSAPTKYASGAEVKNSLLADGCVIEGTVENSILFRGVHVGKGTVVKNSILLQDTVVGDHASLNCVIADKNAVIKSERSLSGHSSMPFFIGKNKMV